MIFNQLFMRKKLGNCLNIFELKKYYEIKLINLILKKILLILNI